MKDSRTILFLVFQSALAGVLVFLLSRWVFPFTTDSVIYISTAEKIATGQGLVFSNFFVYPAEPDLLPVVLQPPGYPILIAMLGIAGVNGYTAGLLFPRLCFLLLPYLFFLTFRKFMSQALSLIASFVCVFMFAVIKCALMAWADIPYLFFSLLSIVLAFRVVEKKEKAGTFFLLFSGAVAGYAFLLRYIGLTLIASIAGGFVLCALLGLISFRGFVKTAGIYGLGISAVSIPFIVRNYIVFGTVQPYHLPPSQVPLGANIKDYLAGLGEMIFASPAFDKIILCLLMLLAVLGGIFLKRQFRQRKETGVCGFILAFYFVLNSVFLIAFKTTYFAPEKINERYLVQIGWILAGTLVCGVSAGLKKLNTFKPFDIKPITGLILLAFVLIQVFPAADFYFFNKKVKNLSRKTEHYIPLLQSLPEDFVIVSNVPDLAYYFTRRNVRGLSNYTPYGLLALLGQTRKFTVFIVKEDEFASKGWEYPPSWRAPQGYRRVYSDENADLFLPY